MKIGVLSFSQKSTERPERYISKNAAATLVRRLLAVHETHYLIRMVEPRLMSKALPHQPQMRRRPCLSYEHHIEPKLITLTISSSDYLRYVQGL